jgi:hypothetical protein
MEAPVRKIPMLSRSIRICTSLLAALLSCIALDYVVMDTKSPTFLR